MKLYTIGYQGWATPNRMEKFIQTLQTANVNTLIDIRHSSCSSNINPVHRYGPKDWHLQAGDNGIDTALSEVGIEYVWMVELGNPQKQDKAMVILREHISSEEPKWPVNRGLPLLNDIVSKPEKICCLLCACEKHDECHRKVISEAVDERYFDNRLEITPL